MIDLNYHDLNEDTNYTLLADYINLKKGKYIKQKEGHIKLQINSKTKITTENSKMNFDSNIQELK